MSERKGYKRQGAKINKKKRRDKEVVPLNEAEAKRYEQAERIRKSEGSWLKDDDLPDPTTDRRFCGGRNQPKCKGKKNNFTSEPIPDYIMRALQPKKSVHPEYGKLRY